MLRSAIVPIVLTALAAASPAAAVELGALPDGLHTWQIDGTTDVQSCCFNWRSGKAVNSGCRIDGGSLSVATDGACASASGAAQVYVRMSAGAPIDVWLLSSACAVTAETEIEDHGIVSATDSLDWFRSVIESRRVDKDVREQALFALVQTESDAAFRYLDRLLTGR